MFLVICEKLSIIKLRQGPITFEPTGDFRLLVLGIRNVQTTESEDETSESWVRNDSI